MAKAFMSGLDSRLTTHFSARPTPLLGTLKRSAGNWPFYAAAAGSALAMTTNAAASSICTGSIICASGPVTARVDDVARNASNYNAATVQLGNGGSFKLWAGQFSGVFSANGGTSVRGSVGLKNKAGNVKFLGYGGYAMKLRSSAISALAGQYYGFHFQAGGDKVARYSRVFSFTQGGHHYRYFNHKTGFFKGSGGFAGFRFTNSETHALDYGWIRLTFTTGQNGVPNSITVQDWGYDFLGAPIFQGQTEGSFVETPAPEPSTLAMALLAAGAAGVVALRRRKTTASV